MNEWLTVTWLYYLLYESVILKTGSTRRICKLGAIPTSPSHPWLPQRRCKILNKYDVQYRHLFRLATWGFLLWYFLLSTSYFLLSTSYFLLSTSYFLSCLLSAFYFLLLLIYWNRCLILVISIKGIVYPRGAHDVTTVSLPSSEEFRSLDSAEHVLQVRNHNTKFLGHRVTRCLPISLSLICCFCTWSCYKFCWFHCVTSFRWWYNRIYQSCAWSEHSSFVSSII